MLIITRTELLLKSFAFQVASVQATTGQKSVKNLAPYFEHAVTVLSGKQNFVLIFLIPHVLPF